VHDATHIISTTEELDRLRAALSAAGDVAYDWDLATDTVPTSVGLSVWRTVSNRFRGPRFPPLSRRKTSTRLPISSRVCR
jgi:hypothetical protein